MNQKHISQHFEPVQNLFNHPTTTLVQMHYILEKTGCPNNKIDSVINGSIKDLIQNSIPKDGISIEELYGLLKDKITDVSDIYLNKLIAFMSNKNLIHIEQGTVKNLVRSIPNHPIDLD